MEEAGIHRTLYKMEVHIGNLREHGITDTEDIAAAFKKTYPAALLFEMKVAMQGSMSRHAGDNLLILLTHWL